MKTMPQYSLGDVRDPSAAWLAVPTPVALQTVIRDALLNALAFTDGDQHTAAGWLMISPRKMAYQMRRHGIATTYRPAFPSKRTGRAA
jgi:transcriptional regulator with GAF, ATPase, and Fis domain